MPKNPTTLIVFGATTFVIGLCFGALEYKSIFNQVKFTDMAAVLVTFLGICLAFQTYSKWIEDKKREDSYLIAKKYLDAIDECHEYVLEIKLQYDSMCPAAGQLVETDNTVSMRLEQSNLSQERLYKARFTLIKFHREMAFWNVTLSSHSQTAHKELTSYLRSLNTIASVLDSQLQHLLIKNNGDRDEVDLQKKMFDEKVILIDDLIKDRIGMGFDNVFVFSE